VSRHGFLYKHTCRGGATRREPHHKRLRRNKLLKILEDANVPHFLYQDILNWGCGAKSSGYGFELARTTRQAAIAHIERRFHLEHCRPTQVTIAFPEDDLSIEVTRFDFLSQLYSLITDKSLTGDITQLDVNLDDPFATYQSPNGRLGAFNSGAWYVKAHDKLCTQPDDWLCGIMCTCMHATKHLSVPILVEPRSPHSFAPWPYLMNGFATSGCRGDPSGMFMIYPSTAKEWSPTPLVTYPGK
jgi:hypothetical protein